MTTPGQSAAGGFKLPPSVTRTFSNGMKACVMEYHELPLVDFQVIVRAGAAHDPRGKEGLASLVADLLRKGTAKRRAKEIADAVDFVGGVLSASADQDGTRVSAEFMAKDLDLALELLADTLQRPAFAPEEVERSRAETLAELQAIKENPSLLASRRFIELLYGGHPYGHPTTGWESSVATVTQADVKGYYDRHYVPGNVIVVAVGDFRAEEMLQRIERAFRAWPPRPLPEAAIPPVKDPARPGVVLIDKPESTQSQIRMGAVGIRRGDPDYVGIQVANTILGGGFTSRLVEEIRVNRGLSYGASSRFYPLVEQGPFLVSTFTKNETTLEAIKVARQVVEGFRREGATQEELDKARKYLKGSFAIGHQSPDSMADALAEIAFYGLPADYYDTYLQRVEAVSVADVKRIAAERFPVDEMMVVVLGEAERIRKDLETLGPVATAPLSAR
ncbi:MAG TPA: pitrilysin family protein [Candidatus Polarisedimenticolia bacterium]|nr:pitrilysin family protein [Candidatus Polarisedimenticolia bacterium]